MQKTNDKTQNTAEKSAKSKNDKSARLSYISQKTQRLASALYAITRSFPADEPLRAALRNQALELVSSAHALHKDTGGEATTQLPARLQQLCSQLAVARDGGLISAMNCSVLHEEINHFLVEIKDIGLIAEPALTDEYFNGELPTLAAGDIGRNITPAHSSSIGERAMSSDTAGGSKNSASTGTGSTAKEKRRQAILDLFSEQSEITVNDVTDVITGYSTKTIQRDLKALVKAGKLEKHGKRRWTSYTKA